MIQRFRLSSSENWSIASLLSVNPNLNVDFSPKCGEYLYLRFCRTSSGADCLSLFKSAVFGEQSSSESDTIFRESAIPLSRKQSVRRSMSFYISKGELDTLKRKQVFVLGLRGRVCV